MCDLDNRRARVIQSLEELHDLIALRGMQIPRRLVGENQLWAEDDRARDAHELLLAAGKLVREQVFLADNVEAIECVANQADAFLVRDVLVGKWHFQIFEDRQIVDQVIALKHESDVCLMQLIALLDVEFVDRFAKKVVVPGPSAIEHSHDAQQRGFSGPGRPHNRHEFTGLNVQIDSPQQEKLIWTGLDNLLQIPQLY